MSFLPVFEGYKKFDDFVKRIVVGNFVKFVQNEMFNFGKLFQCFQTLVPEKNGDVGEFVKVVAIHQSVVIIFFVDKIMKICPIKVFKVRK